MDKNTYFFALPERLRAEITALLSRRGKTLDSVGEIRLRADAASALYLNGERQLLLSTVSRGELLKTFENLCGGSIYSHVDTLKDGYIALECGVRVGVCARARYDGDRLYSFDEIGSLVFRVQTDTEPECEELTSFFQKTQRGMLIFSPPRQGKTYALRALASSLSLGRDAPEVVVIDERLEFSSLDRRARSLDILSGFKKSDGVKIALRTLSPDIIIMDELSDFDECLKILEFMRGGIRVIASAHASCPDDLKSKAGVSELLKNGVFDTLVGIEIREGERVYRKYD